MYKTVNERTESRKGGSLYAMFLNLIHQFRRADATVDPILETEQERQAVEEAARERKEKRAQGKNEKQVKAPWRPTKNKRGKKAKTEDSLKQQVPANTVSFKT